jgi:glycosyltransferase involved in cell wall biosynthesis
MHVVQALAALSVGGSELVTTEISASLVAKGHRVTVIGGRGPLADTVVASGAEWLDWPIGRKRLATLRYVRRLADWLEQNQPDVVHAHSRIPAWVSYLALRRLPAGKRPAFITSVHGQYTVSPYSAIMARGDHVIAVSQHILDYTLDNYSFVDPGRISVIHGGISKTVFAHGHRPDPAWRAAILAEFPQLAGKRLLLLPARLSRYKGHSVFIEMIASLAVEFPDLHGVLVGPGRPGSRYRAELEGLAERSGILDRITFTGLRTDMREWMSASEIVYNLCSDPPEAFGRTVPEALHLGVPVIGWDHGGVHETLSVMFPEGAVRPDSRPALVDKTRAFLLDRPHVAESSAFGLTRSMEETLGLYQRVLKE